MFVNIFLEDTEFNIFHEIITGARDDEGEISLVDLNVTSHYVRDDINHLVSLAQKGLIEIVEMSADKVRVVRVTRAGRWFGSKL